MVCISFFYKIRKYCRLFRFFGYRTIQKFSPNLFDTFIYFSNGFTAYRNAVIPYHDMQPFIRQTKL